MSSKVTTQSPPTSRALAVLEALATCSNGGLSLSEIARTLGLSTSTTAAILATLDQEAYVERLPSRAYQLGPGLLRLMAGLRARYPLLGAADDELSRLCADVGYGCTLARINTDDIEVILTVGAVDEFEARSGQHTPLYPPYGSIAVAWRSAADIDEWLITAPTPLTDTAAEELRSTLAGIRERGYAVYSVDRDVQTTVNEIRQFLGQVPDQAPSEALRRLLLSTVAGLRIYPTAELATRRRRPVSYLIAPVFGPDQQPRYLVSLHVMRDAVSADDLDRYGEALLQTAADLTALSGRRPNANSATARP